MRNLPLFVCTVCGIVTGYIYDFFRALRITSNHSKILTLIFDFLFWLAASIIVILTFYFIDGLNLRLYRFLAVFAGNFLYFSFFSGLFLAITEKILKIFVFFLKILFTILKFCGKILKKLFTILFFPFVFLKRLVYKNAENLCEKLNKFLRLSKRI